MSEMTETAFIDPATRILNVAAADGTSPKAAIAATAKALAALIVVASEDTSFDELLKTTLT